MRKVKSVLLSVCVGGPEVHYRVQEGNIETRKKPTKKKIKDKKQK
jgi:hypothetical protein